jgi:hypothetical protein
MLLWKYPALFISFLTFKKCQDLEIQAGSPSEFVRAAKGIVSEHNELKRRNRLLRHEIRRLELEQAGDNNLDTSILFLLQAQTYESLLRDKIRQLEQWQFGYRYGRYHIPVIPIRGTNFSDTFFAQNYI